MVKNNSNVVQLVSQQLLKIAKLFSRLLAMLFLFLTVAAHAGDLVITVENIKSEQGNIRAAIFNNPKDFTKTPYLAQLIAAKSGTVSFTFKGVPTGQYAVSAFHDINGNEKLDTNFVGKPVEPYGFSRDARGTFGPPSFEEATIQVDETVKTAKIFVQ